MIEGQTVRRVVRRSGKLSDEFVVRFTDEAPTGAVVDNQAFATENARGPFLAYSRQCSAQAVEFLRAEQLRSGDEDLMHTTAALKERILPGPDNRAFFTEELLALMYPRRNPRWDEALFEGASWLGLRVLTEVDPFFELVFMVSPVAGTETQEILGQVRAITENLGTRLPDTVARFDTHMMYPTIEEPVFRCSMERMSRATYLTRAELISSREPPG